MFFDAVARKDPLQKTIAQILVDKTAAYRRAIARR